MNGYSLANLHINFCEDGIVNNFSRNTETEICLAPVPMADALEKSRENISVQFHVLPLSNWGSISSSIYKNKYEHLYGPNYLASEAVFSGNAFDTFFFSEGVIQESESLAANLFGAKNAFFVTTGTTVSNQIALNALIGQNSRILVDRNCHQSIHFALHAMKVPIDYISSVYECALTGRCWWSLEDLIEKAWHAQQADKPYDVLVINGQSYDGIRYNISEILLALDGRGVNIQNLLVDEAWASSAYFHEEMKTSTAMHAAQKFSTHLNINIVATHSVHKSMSSLRQASMILCYGSAALVEQMKLSRFKLHTTSPNYPILVSIDLARAQMSDEGASIMRRCEMLANRLQDAVESDSHLSMFSVNSTSLPASVRSYVTLDPTKVSVNVSRLSRSPSELKELLHRKYGIWVNRCTSCSILLNIHIGISEQGLDQLLEALRQIQRDELTQQVPEATTSHRVPKSIIIHRSPDVPTTFPDDRITPATQQSIQSLEATSPYAISEHFIIPYPPGVPIVFPGEPITPIVQQRIQSAKHDNANVFTI